MTGPVFVDTNVIVYRYDTKDPKKQVRAACRKSGTKFAEGSPPNVGPLGQITQRPWGEESFYVNDPFGNPLCFVSRESVFTGRED